MHNETSPLAGQIVTITSPDWQGTRYSVEDWWDRVAGESWMFCKGNPACLDYACRSVAADLPIDDEVLYGKINGAGKLIHISEIAVPETTEA